MKRCKLSSSSLPSLVVSSTSSTSSASSTVKQLKPTLPPLLWSEKDKNGVDLSRRFWIRNRQIQRSVQLFSAMLPPSEVKEMETDQRNYAIYRRKLDESLEAVTDIVDASVCQHITSLCEMVYAPLEKMFRRVYPLMRNIYDNRHPPTPFTMVFRPEKEMNNFEVHSYLILGLIFDAETRYSNILESTHEVNEAYAKWFVEVLEGKDVLFHDYAVKWKQLVGNWRVLLRLVEHLFDTCALYACSDQVKKEIKEVKKEVDIVEEIEDV